MRLSILARLLVFSGLAVVLVGCDAQRTRPKFGREAEFAEGAFPPVISDTDYHQNAWTRTNCLTCHETGVSDAPVVQHASLPPAAVHAKCRTCHVAVPGITPSQ